MALLGSDIYDIQNFMNELAKENIDADENTLAMGIFGYMIDSFSHLTQNNVIVASEYINEMFPTRVKYEKNILDHAMLYNVTDINATPSTIRVTICLLEDDVIKNLKDNKLYIDKKCPIYIGDFEFHLEYDIILTRSILNRNNSMTTYTAMYDIQRKNPISNISNPYLTAPIVQTIGNNKYIFITCQLRQVKYIESFKKVITNDIITNKTFEFEFENQLAAFDMKITDGDDTFYIKPLLQGSSSSGLNEEFCYYKYIDSNNIRILFDSRSYIPTINTDITIYLQTTEGLEGNFEYVDDIITSLTSETYGYTDLSILVKPLSDAEYGLDRTSVEELKNIVPREALARGSITTNTDLNNYFNTISTDNNKLTFLKKADNQVERLYYSYLLLKDENNIIVPTNTIPINLLYQEIKDGELVAAPEFDSMTENRFIIKPGTKFRLENGMGKLETGEYFDDNNGFVYSLPFLMIINVRPLLYTSYYLNIINKRYPLLINSDNINPNSELQFIALSSTWKRQFNIDRDTYKLNFQCTQNINVNKNLVEVDDDGNIVEKKIRAIGVIQSKKVFIEAELTGFKLENESYIYEFEFKFKTEDLINDQNQIMINGLYKADINASTESTIEEFIERVSDIDIYILYEDPDGNVYGKMGLENYIPLSYNKPIDKYTVSNIYTVEGGLEFFFNYTDIISSKITITQEDINFDNNHYRQSFNLKSVPCVRSTYLNDESKVNSLIDILETKRGYIENALDILEDQFGIDFKFYNTYGPSKTFQIENGETLDKVNINLKFEVALKPNADKTKVNFIKNDIKDYIENLNNTESNLHMSNIITQITNKYLTDTLNFIEFVSINQYPTSYQFLERIDSESLDVDTPPEFINIHYADNEDMGITINIIA